MKPYINRKEAEDLVFLTMLCSKAENIAKEDETRQNPLMNSKTRGWLKRACTIILKQVMQPVVAELSDEAKMKYMSACKGTTVICQPRESMAAYRQRIERERKEEECIVNQNALYTLAELALTGCNPCQFSTDEERKKCVARQTMLELGIPVFDEQATACPYLIKLKEVG